MRHLRASGCLVGLGLLGLLGLAAAPPEASAELTPEAADAVLVGQDTREQISTFTGQQPSACIGISATFDMCEWQLAGADPGWRPLARAIHSGDRLRLLCLLPRDGQPRASGSCSAHPQRSNRDDFKVTPGAGRNRLTRNQREDFEEQSRRRAVAELEAARDLVALCRLMGALPDECHDSARETRICLWRTNSHVEGHGLVAAVIGADYAKRVRLQCELPADGSERPAGSCSAQVGS